MSIVAKMRRALADLPERRLHSRDWRIVAYLHAGVTEAQIIDYEECAYFAECERRSDPLVTLTGHTVH